ncbi:hypothetical protein [Nocardia sp. NPDC052566]|uniref:hypothetical protein n=1 Tax=Nocardia sp. NPDC052566 TaxID=3364330 RepID=UPI0037C5BFA5
MDARTETVVDTENGVEVSLVRLHSPLPRDFPEHPDGLEYLHYLRYRSQHGPKAAAAADAILVMHPGTWAAAQSLDVLARNVVRRAAVHGRSIEWWSLSRRSEGASDRTGIDAAYAADDPAIAVDYYFGGKPVGDKVFEGFRRGARLRYLAELGMARAVLDQHEVLVRELPDPALRKAKVHIGGHSLGGLLAAAYAGWDLDGAPGHDQCAGLIAIDTLVSPDPLELVGRGASRPLGALAGVLHNAVTAGLRRGLLPRVTPLGPTNVAKFFVLLHILGVAAVCDGTRETTVHHRLPETAGWEIFLRILGARRYRDLFGDTASIRRLRLTGEALFGVVGSDTSMPIDPLQAAMGSFDGPTVARTSFPVPRATRRIPGLRTAIRAVFGAPTSVPADPSVLYGWRYGGSADLRALAGLLAGGPLNTFETYFPMRVHYDLWTALAGARSSDLSGLAHADGVRSLPTLHALSGPDRFVPQALRLTGLSRPDAFHAPGYGHIDMVIGTDHPDEPVTAAFTDYLLRHVTPTATPVAGEQPA